MQKRDGKYRAYITVNGKHKGLGLFENFEDAVAVRKKVELEYYEYERE